MGDSSRYEEYKQRVIQLLEESDPDLDAFFFVFSKDGKKTIENPDEDFKQVVIGELPVVPTMVFMFDFIRVLAKNVNEPALPFLIGRLVLPMASLLESTVVQLIQEKETLEKSAGLLGITPGDVDEETDIEEEDGDSDVVVGFPGFTSNTMN